MKTIKLEVLNEQALHNELKQVIDYRKAIQRIEKRIREEKQLPHSHPIPDNVVGKDFCEHCEALDKALEIVKEELK